jgi:alkaline phosphatase D
LQKSVPDRRPTRRDVLKAANAATLGAALSALSASEAAAGRLAPESVERGDGFEIDREQATDVFPQSVASGGPTPSGVLLWTRLDPQAYDGETPLGVEIATDEAFERMVYKGTVPAEGFGPARDHAATVDVDGELDPDSRYFYRFVYAGNASEVGRCRTLPAPDTSPDSLRLAVASCNNYLHGYFGAFGHVADEDADFLLHLGDFIYEYGGDGVGDRAIHLPSGHGVAHDLADYRHLYRTYRSDEHLQRALRQHTLVHTWDDHEVVNDRWWNYETGAPETYSHPRGRDPAFMRQLYVDAIRAYTEYVPVRATYEPAGDRELAPERLHEDFRLYRSFAFGDLADLLVTDERLYRSPPPQSGEPRAAVPVETAAQNPGRTMLGDDQRRWLISEIADSDATWTLWANEVLAAEFEFLREDGRQVNADAWDGYGRERNRVLSALADADVESFVALTGDMHSYLAAYLRRSYDSPSTGKSPPDGEDSPPDDGASPRESDDRVGVEFMAPAISSDNLVEMGELPETGTGAYVAGLETENTHVEWFDSSHWGYAVVEVGRDEIEYSAYAVDRSVDSADAPKELLRRYRVPAGTVEMERVDGN